MPQTCILKKLVNLGLTQHEAEVYIFLSRKGRSTAREITAANGVSKAQVYRNLKNLQSKGLVEAAIELPTKFTAVSIEKVLNLFVRTKKAEVISIEKNKRDLISSFKLLSPNETSKDSSRIMVLSGRNNIFAKIAEMAKAARREFIVLSRPEEFMRAEKSGANAEISRILSRLKISSKHLIIFSKANASVLKSTFGQIRNNGRSDNYERRCVNFERTIPGFVAVDECEMTVFLTNNNEFTDNGKNELGLWTNSKLLVSAFTTFFDELWRDSLDVKALVNHETNALFSETIVFKNPADGYKKYRDTIRAAQRDIIHISPSKRFFERHRKIFEQLQQKGVSIRVMTALKDEGEKYLQRTNKFSQVKYTPIVGIVRTIIDGKQLFGFKTSLNKEKTQHGYSDYIDMFYTNAPSYVAPMLEMLNAIWNSAQEVPPTQTSKKTTTDRNAGDGAISEMADISNV